MSEIQKQSLALNATELARLAEQIKVWGRDLGFQAVAITDTGLSQAEKTLQHWLEQ